MSSDEIAIRVRDVSKHYLLFNQPQDRLKQSIVPRLQRLVGHKPKQYYCDFAALNHVSFDISRGETVGVIGRNGSGKSTLLQVICGTLRPNAGHVEVNGRIAALLELGAGFNPEFTGRENVYLNAAILGLLRGEIDARFADIAAFADIGDFIEQPVKTYSSGMYVRLAFATAINVDPDILVVDEALAVGDEAFQRKCFARIEQIQERGGTILFVTHGVQTVVQLCSRAFLFDGGELILDGRPKLVTSQYQRLVNLTGEEARLAREEIRALGAEDCEFRNNLPSDGEDEGGAIGSLAPPRIAHMAAPAPSAEGYDPKLIPQSRLEYETHGARIRDARLLNAKKETVNVFEPGKRYTFEYFVDFTVEATEVGFGMLAKTTTGLELAGATTFYSRALRKRRIAAGSTVRVSFDFNCGFTPGTFFLNAGVLGTVDGTGRYLHRVLDCVGFRVVSNEVPVATGYVDLGFRPSIEVAPRADVLTVGGR